MQIYWADCLTLTITNNHPIMKEACLSACSFIVTRGNCRVWFLVFRFFSSVDILKDVDLV